MTIQVTRVEVGQNDASFDMCATREFLQRRVSCTVSRNSAADASHTQILGNFDDTRKDPVSVRIIPGHAGYHAQPLEIECDPRVWQRRSEDDPFDETAYAWAKSRTRHAVSAPPNTSPTERDLAAFVVFGAVSRLTRWVVSAGRPSKFVEPLQRVCSKRSALGRIDPKRLLELFWRVTNRGFPILNLDDLLTPNWSASRTSNGYCKRVASD